MKRDNDREAAFAAGLRAIADAVEADETLPLPYNGDTGELLWFLRTPETLLAVRALMEPGSTIAIDSGAQQYPLHLTGRIGGVRVRAFARPEDVCEVISLPRTVEVHEYTLDGEPIGGVVVTARMLRVYLSGPISGHNLAERRTLFGVMTDRLVARGYAVVNPLEVVPGAHCRAGKGACGPDSGHAWECWMRHDLLEMLTCDEVAVLPGWERSRGARIEADLASAVGLPVREVAGYLIGVEL